MWFRPKTALGDVIGARRRELDEMAMNNIKPEEEKEKLHPQGIQWLSGETKGGLVETLLVLFSRLRQRRSETGRSLIWIHGRRVSWRRHLSFVNAWNFLYELHDHEQ